MRISIEGNIGTGKSRLLAGLRDNGYFTVQEPVADWQEMLQRFYKNKQRWALSMNLTALLSFLDVPANAPNGGLVVVERSPLSCLEVFARLQKNEGMMSEKEWQLFQDLHTITAWTPDVIIYLLSPATTCLDRVRGRARPGEEDISHDYLSKVHFAHNTMLRYFTEEFHVVDSSQDAPTVLSRVQDILKAYQD